MDNTSERHIPNEEFKDEAELYNHLMHVATYQYAYKFVAGKRVLDFGCGSGYGSYMLSGVADSVTAVDVSREAVDFAKGNYASGNLIFKTIPELTDDKYDVITSFQVIEHVSNEEEYIQKIKSLLRPDGCLLISTPNKRYRLFNYIQRPWNIFHLKEYSGNSFSNLLLKYFKSVDLLKIGSKANFVLNEISRTKKQRLITLPCTLIIYPHSLRVFLLNFQIKIYDMIHRFRKNSPLAEEKPAFNADFKNKYSATDIEFSNTLAFSTDLLAICKTH